KSNAHAATPARTSSARTQLPMQPPAPVTTTGPGKLARSIEKRSFMRIPLTVTVAAANLPSPSRNFPKNTTPRQIEHSHGIGDPLRGAQELRLDRGRPRRGHRGRGRRVLRAGGGGGDDPRADGVPAALPPPALGWPAPARRDGARDRKEARGVPVR